MHLKRFVSPWIYTAACALGALVMTTSGARAQANLVVNGDFSAGNTGFSSDDIYIGGNGPAYSNPGQYDITTNPSVGLTDGYASYGDHTTGTGNMLFVDASSNSGSRLWFETFNLAPNTIYSYSYWGASADSGSPGVLGFFVGGTHVGSNFDLSTTSGLWQQTTGSFNSGVGGTVTLSLVDANTTGDGNDFTIDDIRVTGAAAGAAPEPGTFGLLGFGALALGGVATRRRAKGV